MWRLQPSNMAATVFVLLLAGVRGLQLEDREERICAFSRSPKGAEPVSTNELRGELQENGTIRCSRGSRCYGLWERRADGEMELLNQGGNEPCPDQNRAECCAIRKEPGRASTKQIRMKGQNNPL